MSAVVTFRPIDLDADWPDIVDFHRDVFRLSEGSDAAFSEDAYRAIMLERLREFPRGQMMVLAAGEVAGQVEIWEREYEGRPIGYVSLFYLLPPWRGHRLGRALVQFAEDYFRQRGLDEYHLRVAQRNERAVRFYQHAGFRPIAFEEGERPTWRMAKNL